MTSLPAINLIYTWALSTTKILFDREDLVRKRSTFYSMYDTKASLGHRHFSDECFPGKIIVGSGH